MRVTLALACLLLAGCSRGPSARPDAVWGERGVLDGMLARPRAIAIDRDDRVYVVDFTARIQAFDPDGKYLGPTWRTPDFRNGRPSGLGIDRDNNLIVADSHYHCLRIYSPQGDLLRTLGEEGRFGYVSDAVQDADGFFYVTEFGPRDRMTKLSPDGKAVADWGKSGTGPGEFNRLRAVALGPDGNLYVADALNHRVQVLTRDGTFVRQFGRQGTGPGELQYPYDLAFDRAGRLIVAEYGNHRLQRFAPTGEPLGTWGTPGRKPGQLANPWAVAVDSRGRVLAVDTENHRVQRVRWE